MSESNRKSIWKTKIRPALSRIKWMAGAPWRGLQQISLRPISWLHGGPTMAIGRLHQLVDLTPERVLAGYAQGIFPTGEPNGNIVWHCPAPRSVIATERVHISRRLKGYLRKDVWQIEFNQQFGDVMLACADRQKTWITLEILDTYQKLHEMGFAHSVEAYQQDRLIGGGYGVALGKVFFLESMFCREDHASKVAFVRLAEKLQTDGFNWIDCQFMTEHWRRFGAEPMSPDEFQAQVVRDLHHPAMFSNLTAATPATLPITSIPMPADITT